MRIVSTDEAELLYDPARLLPETDSDGAFMTVALGMFVETLAIAAHERRRELEVEMVADLRTNDRLGLHAERAAVELRRDLSRPDANTDR